MGNYTIFQMFENPRRGRKARNFRTNVPKILDLKSSSEQIFSEINVRCPCKKFGKENNGHNRHFYTRVNEHLFWDKNYHIFKHLSLSKHCQDNCDVSCLKCIENGTFFYQLKIKESFHIEQMKLAKLNKRVDHVGLALHF